MVFLATVQGYYCVRYIDQPVHSVANNNTHAIARSGLSVVLCFTYIEPTLLSCPGSSVVEHSSSKQSVVGSNPT